MSSHITPEGDIPGARSLNSDDVAAFFEAERRRGDTTRRGADLTDEMVAPAMRPARVGQHAHNFWPHELAGMVSRYPASMKHIARQLLWLKRKALKRGLDVDVQVYVKRGVR